MKCPVCGIQHRTKRTAFMCKTELDHYWVHCGILCSGLPEGITEENLLNMHSNFDVSYFREIKQKRKEMYKYLDKLKK